MKCKPKTYMERLFHTCPVVGTSHWWEYELFDCNIYVVISLPLWWKKPWKYSPDL